jgi:hypothetical protein
MSIDAVLLGSQKTKQPFKNIQEVIACAKKNPGEVSVATSSTGGAWWLAAMVLQEAARIKFNVIPQEGALLFHSWPEDIRISAFWACRPR